MAEAEEQSGGGTEGRKQETESPETARLRPESGRRDERRTSEKERKERQEAMDERAAFAELLQDMLEQAKINGNRISQEEIQEFFEEMNLTEEQLNHIYSYLVANRIKVTGYLAGPEAAGKAGGSGTEGEPAENAENAGRAAAGPSGEKMEQVPEEKPEPESAFLKMYLRDLRQMEKLTKDEERHLVLRLTAAAKGADVQEEVIAGMRERFVNHKLRYVVSRARKYKLGGEFLDELVQEGNIGLITGIERLLSEQEEVLSGGPEDKEAGRLGDMDRADRFLQFIEKEIGYAMDRYLNETYASRSEEQAMVAKVNFVSEAAKAMKEENGEEPTLAQLAAYVNLSEEELDDIINLSADNLKA